MARAMMWSLLLYTATMLAFNWDEVKNTVSGNNAITIVKTYPPTPEATGIDQPAGIPGNIKHAGIIKSIVSLVKIVSGVAEIIVR